MRVLGMLSGTSHDGIDLAVVEFTPDGDVLHARIEERRSVPYSPALRAALVAALPPARPGLAEVCALDTGIGREFAAAAASVAQEVDAVCSHGQTVFHWVQDGTVRGTLQLGQPAWIAEATGVPVVSDLRAADVAAGGQGAPLVPLLDRMLLAPFTERGETVAALNLGGIANVTVCAPGAEPVAWDTGPANALVDAVVAADPGHPDVFDRDGRLAASGRVDGELLARFLADPYYARPAPKSCGKELFHAGYVAEVLRGRELPLTDLVATLTELTARTVAAALAPVGVARVFASGGGVRNPVLLAAIARHLPGVQVTGSDDLDCPADDKEAVAFALLGWATLHGLPGNVPSCTGASGERVLGRLTPGRRGLPAVPALPRWPGQLRLG
ncbi:anhydro-N-acetylmuramic acid kinase [Kineococcus sp. SYSU DK001]|uniref:anhydro-N-acetylmuramic acid kinase n=1 Tax=Kineococcus sp. SYSU DK001 TaxID=3383122 RepID=UPI003D7E986C